MPSSRATRASRRAAAATGEGGQNEEGSVDRKDVGAATKRLRSRSSDTADPGHAPDAAVTKNMKKNAGVSSSTGSSLKSPSTSTSRRTRRKDGSSKTDESTTTDQLASPSLSTGPNHPTSEATIETPPTLAVTTTYGGDAVVDDDDEIDVDQAIEYVHHFHRKRQIEERVKVIELPDAPTAKKRNKKSRKSGGGGSKSSQGSSSSSAAAEAETSIEIPYTPKTDTHWDFVMKGK